MEEVGDLPCLVTCGNLRATVGVSVSEMGDDVGVVDSGAPVVEKGDRTFEDHGVEAVCFGVTIASVTVDDGVSPLNDGAPDLVGAGRGQISFSYGIVLGIERLRKACDLPDVVFFGHGSNQGEGTSRRMKRAFPGRAMVRGPVAPPGMVPPAVVQVSRSDEIFTSNGALVPESGRLRVKDPG